MTKSMIEALRRRLHLRGDYKHFIPPRVLTTNGDVGISDRHTLFTVRSRLRTVDTDPTAAAMRALLRLAYEAATTPVDIGKALDGLEGIELRIGRKARPIDASRVRRVLELAKLEKPLVAGWFRTGMGKDDWALAIGSPSQQRVALVAGWRRRHWEKHETVALTRKR